MNCNQQIVVIEKERLQVRVVYKDLIDAGHLYGPFSTRPDAESFLYTVASREDVKSAKIEPNTL